MLEDQVANLLQRYLGNYIRGLNKEALKISVWKGDVELTNMQLKPEALNALKLPVKVKAGFLGSVKLKVPWSRLGQEPVLVYLDRILILAEPATQVDGCSAETIQEAKKKRVQEMEMQLLESWQQMKSEMNTSWLGSLITTIIGNLKMSITNIHIRYEDLESNPGHPFAAGVTLARLSAVTVDDLGKETFATGGALERIQKSAELERLAFYFDSDICPWNVEKQWEVLLPSEWNQIFEIRNKDGKSAKVLSKDHSYILQPVTGNSRYIKLRLDDARNSGQPIHRAEVNLDDVTLCLSKDGYRDILKLAENFTAFNQRLKYAHYRPSVPIKVDPRSWWKYAYRVVADEMKKASGEFSWEQVLRYARLRKKYVTLYASLLRSDVSRMVVDDNKDIEKLDRELDIEVILQWRMLAHKFVEQSEESDVNVNKQKAKRSWWSFGWSGSSRDGGEPKGFSDEDWEQLNKLIGYKDGSDKQLLTTHDKGNLLHSFLEIRMKHNASKLITAGQKCLADLSCDGLDCSIKLYSEAKIFDVKLGSYKLSSPDGLLAESASVTDSLVGVFSYKPLDAQIDWSFVAKASPCYMTYLKDSIDQIISFFKGSTAISHTIAMETAAAVQMTLDGVRRTAQRQVSRALKDHTRFVLDLDIAAPKITIPTKFCPDQYHETKLLLDLGNLMLSTKDYWELDSPKDDLYITFNVVLSDVSAFLVDGDYSWSQAPLAMSATSVQRNHSSFLPIIDKCGVVLRLQQIQSENPLYPSTRLAVRLPSMMFHFSPARYHRLMEVAKIFQGEDGEKSDFIRPWDQADFEGWLSLLSWKGVGNREAVWQRRFLYLVGTFLYVLENPASRTYKQYLSLRGKQVYQVPPEFTGNVEHVLAVCDSGQSSTKVVEVANALILRCDSDDSCRTWQNRLQAALYRASGSAAIRSQSEASSPISKAESLDTSNKFGFVNIERLFVTGVLDELRICFSCNYQGNQNFSMILLAKESSLFEFRAIGGQVELSFRENDLFIGTVLKSLEIEDQLLYDGMSMPRYLARSFIKNTEVSTLNIPSASDKTGEQNFSSTKLSQIDGEEKFFEASDNLGDLGGCSVQPQGFMSQCSNVQDSLTSKRPSIKPPSFSRIAGLLPGVELRTESTEFEKSMTLDSFVKAQIAFYNPDSPLYNGMDKQVIVTLATLSFFCYRPTILAILEFVNAINTEEVSPDASRGGSSSASENISRHDNINEPNSAVVEESVVKGLLGKGKSRIIFYLTLNMARAQIFLMSENGTCMATLSQNNLRTDIKVFPSSFNIKAALGNLKISEDSLPSNHPYYWVCDMRNPGGSSFVELDFSSFTVDDEEYDGYDYSLNGKLSEVRIVYLNRFVQEVVSYFMGLVPSNAKGGVKLKDQLANSDKWFTTAEIEGSPALKLDLSFSKPIILMPRRTDSLDYLELDVLHITVQNTFNWLGGKKNEMSAIHLEILTIQVMDINLTVGCGMVSGESIIQDVKGLSVVIRRSLRDLMHEIPAIEASIKVDELRASLSNKEYQIITECTMSNISEAPRIVSTLDLGFRSSSNNIVEPLVSHSSDNTHFEHARKEVWITMEISVVVKLAELCLHSGSAQDSSLATVQASGTWILYKSSSSGEGLLLATLKDFIVVDDREGTKEEFRLAIGGHESIERRHLRYIAADDNHHLISYIDRKGREDLGVNPVPTMLILDVKFKGSLTSVSLCIQRPHLLVAPDFLLAIVEFFVPTVRSMVSNDKEDNSLNIDAAIVLDQPIYFQDSFDFSLSPLKPLIVDDERFDQFIYDGKGGNLFLQDRKGVNISSDSTDTLIYVANGKSLQFKNVIVKNGEYLDSCIFLGTNSSYSASEADNVILESGIVPQAIPEERTENAIAPEIVASRPTDMEFVVELQAIGPQLTFYNTLKNVGESLVSSTKLLHAQLDIYCRVVLKGDNVEVSGKALGLKVESNGIRVLEPFDTCIEFSNVSGKMNMNLSVSYIFMNFSFSILRLFLAVEEDILEFLRMTSKKVSVVCSQFDKVGTIYNYQSGQTYAFWRPRAPPGFAVLGDCLTPLNEPPSKGVLAVNTSFARVKKPVSFKLIWTSLTTVDNCNLESITSSSDSSACTSSIHSIREDGVCSIWFPVAPQGYVALGLVTSAEGTEPPLSSTLCILASLVSACPLKDCIPLSSRKQHAKALAFWRVDNSFGSFLPAKPSNLSLDGKAYELRRVCFRYSEPSSREAQSLNVQGNTKAHDGAPTLERSTVPTSSGLFEAIASFRLVWWNQGAPSQKKLSIWRPIVPQRMVYLGDVAVQGYEPPNMCIVLHDVRDEGVLRPPLDFQLVGHIKKHKGIENICLWLPQAPPGYVSLGCIASKSSPKHEEFSSLRCIRSDMVTGDQFPEESLWDTSNIKVAVDPFSIWSAGNELGTFLVRKGFRKPPKRFALKLADASVSSASNDTTVSVDIKTFSAAVYDDYGGLMVPLCNISFSGIGCSLHGRPNYLNSSVSFSLAARSYNDKYDAWEPLIEPTDGFLRYQYDLNAPGSASQLRLASTRDLNLNISVSNTNMLLQAYSSWNNLSDVHESLIKGGANRPMYDGRSVIDSHHRKNYYIIPQNKLGQDIFVRFTENKSFSNIIKMPSGDNKPLKVPVSKNMLQSHLKGKLSTESLLLVTIIIADAELPTIKGLDNGHYIASVQLSSTQDNDSMLKQQSTRTCCAISEHSLHSGLSLVKWNEMFFFKVDLLDYFMVEFIITDIGKGESIGFYSAPLKKIAHEIHSNSNSAKFDPYLTWVELSPEKTTVSQEDIHIKPYGRLRCAVILSIRSENESYRQDSSNESRPGFIQISPAKDGPWTSVRLNYATPAACWRLGNDVVASEVIVTDGSRYVNIRSLVSVTNNTEFIIDLRLKAKASTGKLQSVDDRNENEEIVGDSINETDEFFEIEKYIPSIGWVGCSAPASMSDEHDPYHMEGEYQGIPDIELPSGWEWTDDLHVDNTLVNTADGWVYAPDPKQLKWPESYNHINFVNYARQRRWIRNRKLMLLDTKKQISVGLLKPGDTSALPLQGLSHPLLSYFLQLRPKYANDPNEYSWSTVLTKLVQTQISAYPEEEESSEIFVSDLVESEMLMYCSKESENSSENALGLWFCLRIQATEIGKDVHSDPIHDWKLVIDSPLSIINYLPHSAEFSVLRKQSSGQLFTCHHGVFNPGETAKIYTVDLRDPLYFSLLPQGGWEAMHEAVMIPHPSKLPSKIASLRNTFSGRIAQVIFEQNLEKNYLIARLIRIYAPYWISSARCPPLTYTILDISERRKRKPFSIFVQSNHTNEKVLWKITDDEMLNGYTISSALNFKQLGLSVSIGECGEEHFGPVKDLSFLGNMDGSLDLYAYDCNGNCIRIFISSKPCPHQAVPTKVISVRPFMAFTNRIGQDLFVRFSASDQPRILHASDSRVSFIYRDTGGSEKLQVRFEDSEWSFPIEILKEDTITLVLWKVNGSRRFLRVEIRGYEEGSRFLVVFRLGSIIGPIRIENRMAGVKIGIRQSGFSDDKWIQLQPLSTTNFSWEDPFGQRLLDISIYNGSEVYIPNVSLEKSTDSSSDLVAHGFELNIIEVEDIIIARFTNVRRTLELHSNGLSSVSKWGTSTLQDEMQSNAVPIELIIELGVLGVSLIDHRPRELLYLYLERVFVSYSTGYDAGTTSRFKLIVGQLQLDNQLPLTVMPVLLAPDHMGDILHPVFKATITMCNESRDGIQVYPYVYIRVTESCWRLNIHEPIIWGLLDFYYNLHTDRIPSSSSITQVDPEIRIDLIDVSEIRLKFSLETAPTQRPHGVLGIWSPIISAVGNAFKIQIHLRKVMHRNRFIRKSSIIPAIINRIKRDLIHNPLHLIFSIDVLGMTKSTLASLSKGFAELSTDGQFLQRRSKQVWSRRITGVSDGFLQGTEALAQGVAFGVSGVVTKPVESARQGGLLGLAHGLGRAFLGFVVQPVSGALDFISLTVDGIGASCASCFELLNNKAATQRVKNPRAIHANGVIMEYSETEAIGQMILYLAEATRHIGCTDLFKEPSKYAWSDYYEDHFIVPYQRIILITNKRVMLLQCLAADKLDKRPCKIIWDVPWEELMALELAKAGYPKPSHLIIHLKNFKKTENFVRLVKCSVDEEEDQEPQAVRICSAVRKLWKAYQSDMKILTLKVPSSQRHVQFACNEVDGRDSRNWNRSMIKPREYTSHGSVSDDRRFIKHIVNFQKIWSSEQDPKGRCTLCPKQVMDDGMICSIWRPLCPDGYISVGDIARVGIHPPNVAAVYRDSDGRFAPPVGYDLVWRNCIDDYVLPVSIWHPRPPEGFVSVGCVGVASFKEPDLSCAYCVSAGISEETIFEDPMVWTAPDSYPWACYLYQIQSEALHFSALRQPKEESDLKPMRVSDHLISQQLSEVSGET